MLLKNILGEARNKLFIILRDSMNLREGLKPFAAFLGEPLSQNKEKLENRELSYQSFSEIYKSPRRFGMKRINTQNNCLKSKNPL
jgi:hypothetical protein